MGIEQEQTQPLMGQPAPVYQSYQQQQPQPYGYAPQQPVYGQQAGYATTTTVVAPSHGHHHHHDPGYTGALIFFILGFFFGFLWLGGISYLRSKNSTARGLGIASVILFCVCLVIAIIVISTNH